MSKIKYILLFTFLNSFVFAQKHKIDSLEHEVIIAKHDTTKLLLLLYLSQICEATEILKYANPANELADKLLIKYPSHNNTRKNILDCKALALSNIGYIYDSKGNIPKALDNFSKSLKIYEEINCKREASYVLGNIASIYDTQGDINKAIDYYNKGLNIQEEIGDKNGIAASLNYLGSIYSKKGDKKKAFNYFSRSLKSNEDSKNKRGIAQNLSNIGSTLLDIGDSYKALDFCTKSLNIYKEINDKQGVSIALYNIGRIYFNQEKYKISRQYIDSSLLIGKQIGFPQQISNAENLLSKIDSELGDYKSAFNHYKQFIIYRDSIKSTETQKASIQNQFKYEFDKKEAVLKEQQEKDRLLSEEKSRFQQIIIYSVGIGLLLVIAFSIFIFRSLQKNKKSNKIITLQKQEVEKQKELVEIKTSIIEEKHKEITDSINYAERIQRALLASDKLLNSNLKDYFILFKPKDIVSGDFYWATKVVSSSGVENFILVTADSTGHGVPGAIMSIVNIASLKEAVIQGAISPNQLLNETRKLIIENLKNDGSAEGGKDGMDASVLSFDFKGNVLYFSGANNPIWIIRNKELIEIKADRMPVGKHERDQESFTLHSFHLQKGDVIYSLTDGFADQFGGSNGKKFKYKQLQELLISIKDDTMKLQRQKLNETFDIWKGNLEQVDDVCVIGIRI